ncbi:hypothetical protein PPACK8108_LOCUS3372 [Phakopsora pachyrhizi]|uniref:Uncharacterized protein n=1 Tax=Phakopsora pachyrhizi TaxID=170000 RepID=A0AAV0AME5_PHAPC|nr:hypothetical protein PPACK8108_LOCUS3372 [Phakopsora pachyrhizi]
MSENKGNIHPLATTTEHCILTNRGIDLDFGHWFLRIGTIAVDEERELGLFQKAGNQLEKRPSKNEKEVMNEENEEEREQEEASIRDERLPQREAKYNFANFASLQHRKVCNFAKFATLTLIN